MTTAAFQPGEDFALALDANDPLRAVRAEFLIPPAAAANDPAAALRAGEGEPRAVYLTGNSLGCQPRGVAARLARELDDWARLGVEGHLHGRDPWLAYHESLRGPLARLVGAMEREVVAMNSLTVNLHLLMTSFYRPTRHRHKIIIEDSAFPSDSHAVTSQAELHADSVGFDAERAVVRLKPRPGEATLRTDDIVRAIEREGPEVELVMLGAVNYLTGQWFEMEKITAAGHEQGANVGWDLAHAIGNVPVQLHDWNVDFAAWCSYKYLNGGPGAVAGAFVHEKHCRRDDIAQMAGWWGNDPASRFKMGPEFVPVSSADRWQLSNPPIFSLTPVKSSLELFDRAGVSALRAKSERLTAYLWNWIERVNTRRRAKNGSSAEPIRVLTPADPARRGCQLSLVFPGDARDAAERLAQRGVIVDFREPNVVRAAPVPLYNSFHDVWRFGAALEEIFA